MYAYAIHTILNPTLIGAGKQAPAGSVFPTNAKEFDRLEALGAARAPTDEEIAIAETKGTLIAVPEVAGEPDTAEGGAKPPESGDENDPNSRPKGAKKAAAKVKEEEI